MVNGVRNGLRGTVALDAAQPSSFRDMPAFLRCPSTHAVRSTRRHLARRRQEQRIEQLEADNLRLQHELASWYHWWHGYEATYDHCSIMVPRAVAPKAKAVATALEAQRMISVFTDKPQHNPGNAYAAARRIVSPALSDQLRTINRSANTSKHQPLALFHGPAALAQERFLDELAAGLHRLDAPAVALNFDPFSLLVGMSNVPDRVAGGTLWCADSNGLSDSEWEGESLANLSIVKQEECELACREIKVSIHAGLRDTDGPCWCSAEVVGEISPSLQLDTVHSVLKFGDVVFVHDSPAIVVRVGYGAYAGMVRICLPHEDLSAWSSGRWVDALVCRPCLPGMPIVFTANVISDDVYQIQLLDGMRGLVRDVAAEGDVLIMVGDLRRLVWIFRDNLAHLKAG